MNTKPAPLPRLFTIKDVADHLRTSAKTVRRWIACKEMRVHQIGRQLRVSEDDLTMFVLARRK